MMKDTVAGRSTSFSALDYFLSAFLPDSDTERLQNSTGQQLPLTWALTFWSSFCRGEVQIVYTIFLFLFFFSFKAQ